MNASDLIPDLDKIKAKYVNKNDSDLVQFFQDKKFKMDTLMYITIHNNKIYKNLKNEYETFKRKYSFEINNLNKTIIKKKNIINELLNDIKTQKKESNKIINKKVNERISVYKEEILKLNDTLSTQNKLIDSLKLENEKMKYDYENFKIIKNFEIIKNNLKKYVKDLSDVNELNKFLTNIEYKDFLESLFNIQFENIISKYHELRIERNNIAHLLY